MNETDGSSARTLLLAQWDRLPPVAPFHGTEPVGLDPSELPGPALATAGAVWCLPSWV